MRLLVTGSRTWNDTGYVERTLDGLLAASTTGFVMYHGACPTGADAIADRWALQRQHEGHMILVVRCPAAWRNDAGEFDKGAGLRRNTEMVAAAVTGGLVAGPLSCHAFIRDGSRGASHCAKAAKRAGIPTTVHRWEWLEALS